MSRGLPPITLTACLLWLTAGTAFADHHEGDHHRQHDAHVHGHSELTLAIEGDRLELGLESPSGNLLGFEHRATTPEQLRAVEAARAVLESPQSLFVFVGSRCTLEYAEIDTTALSGPAEQHHDEHGGEEHHHDDDHDRGHDNDHDQHHDQDHNEHHEESSGDGETHSEISASYRYRCGDTSQLKSVSVELFDRFEGIEQINAMWITDSGQGAAQLRPGAKVIELR